MEKKGDSRGKMQLVASRLSDLAPPFLDGAPLPCARPLRTPVGIYALAPPVLPRDPVPPPNIRSTYASRSMLSSPFDRSWRVKFHLNGAGDAGHPISNLPPHSMCKRSKADSKLIPVLQKLKRSGTQRASSGCSSPRTPYGWQHQPDGTIPGAQAARL